MKLLSNRIGLIRLPNSSKVPNRKENIAQVPEKNILKKLTSRNEHELQPNHKIRQ